MSEQDKRIEGIAKALGGEVLGEATVDGKPVTVMSASLDTRRNNALRPDAQAFDEIRIITVPRYKTSGLSGDEWRIHGETQFYRKGELVHSVGHRDVKTCAGMLYADFVLAIDDGKAYFAGDGIHCDQEGCSRLASVTYRRKKQHCRNCGEAGEYQPETFRHFCEEHKRRGDCGIDDADDNYKTVTP